MSLTLVQIFDYLSHKNIKPIALRPNSKIPSLKNWNHWDKAKNRELLDNSSSNIGILLGDIMDVEGDTLQANKLITKLIGDYPHPCYKSKKSFHHLFLNDDSNLRIIKYNGVEFRGYGHQSVLPPSKVNDIKYEWVNIIWPIPPLPKQLKDYLLKLQNKKSKKRLNLKPDHMRICCVQCRKYSYIHKVRFNLELIAFKELGQQWQCKKCRKQDLRLKCRLLRKSN